MAAEDHSVLIIDDDSIVRERVAAHLNQLGYLVLQSGGGTDAVALFHQTQPDTVLCDVKLTAADGRPLLQRLVEDPAMPPVIALSNAGEMHDVLEALRMGAVDFLNKPEVDLEVLGLSVARSSEQGALRRENQLYRRQLEEANSELEQSLKLLQLDQQAGRHVQLRMLPPPQKQFGDYLFSHYIIPSLYLSGDFVDYFTVGDSHVVFFIADVSGHGASSAFVTVLLKNLFARKRSDFMHNRDDVVLSPVQMLNRANKELLDTAIGKHVTMCVGVIDLSLNLLSYSVAGHLPLPLLTVNGKCRYLEAGGMPVGLFADAVFEEHQLSLPEDFLLTLFTDGILETLPVDGVIAKEKDLCERLSRPGLNTVQKIANALDIVKVEEVPDDIAVLLISKVVQ